MHLALEMKLDPNFDTFLREICHRTASKWKGLRHKLGKSPFSSLLRKEASSSRYLLRATTDLLALNSCFGSRGFLESKVPQIPGRKTLIISRDNCSLPFPRDFLMEGIVTPQWGKPREPKTSRNPMLKAKFYSVGGRPK